MTHVVALSGGKDSTALALWLAANEPREYIYICTPTGNEPMEMTAHWAMLELRLGHPIIRLTNGTLESWMTHWNMLPNLRMRWCTRVLKIQPCIAFLQHHQPATLYVGLRADEPADEREGMYGPYATYRYPLREIGWTLRDVLAYLRSLNVAIPERTDCAWCPDQRIIEWWRLARFNPESFAAAKAWETRTGHTFRSPTRDTWPASLEAMEAEFLKHRRIRGADYQLPLPMIEDDVEPHERKCRVCSL